MINVYEINLDSLWNSRQKPVNVFQVQRKIRDLTPVEYRYDYEVEPDKQRKHILYGVAEKKHTLSSLTT